MGEEPAFDTFENPSEEAPAYSFEGVAAAVVPQYEVHELTEVPEPAEMSEALSEFDHPAEETGIHREVELSGIQEVEAAPGLSFDDLATLEEPQPSFQGGMEEVGLGVSSFDFNLEGLATQQIEGQEGERIEAPPEFPEVFDFEAVQELKEMPPAEVMMEPVPLAFAGGDLANRANTENAVDRIMGRYFSDELPLLIERSIEDILKRYSIIKPSTILLSGSLREIGSVEIFKLIDSSRLTGKFFAFAPACSAEIYFDKGLVVYALASTDRRTATLKRGFIDETGEGLSDRMSETLSMVANLKDGGFFFERMAMPPALLDMPQRMNVVALLLHGMRRKESGSAESVIGNSLVFIKKVGDIQDFGLDDQEQKVFSLVDGVRNMVDNAELSGFGMAEAKKILHRLVQVGILSNKGGF